MKNVYGIESKSEMGVLFLTLKTRYHYSGWMVILHNDEAMSMSSLCNFECQSKLMDVTFSEK